MILKQYNLGCLSHLSYLIADPDAGLAAVVDPQRDVDAYLEDARKLGVEIRWVLLTHFHADFVAGHLELKERTGAEILLGAAGQAEYPVTPMEDGGSLRFGSVGLEFLATPGHTPEGTSIVVRDLSAPQEPAAVLTGDTLFVGDVGRPDLLASIGVTADELAGMLYDSVTGKLLALPDDTVVYPAHGAGSACGKSIGEALSTTIGEQRALNPALQPMGREAFIAMVTAGLPPAPRYFGHDARLNREQRGLMDDRPEERLPRLDAAALLALQEQGVPVLDVRPSDAFAKGHLPGSRHAALDGRFAHWAGSQFDPTQRIAVVVAEGDEREAVTRLGRIGIDDVAGLLVVGDAGLPAGLPRNSFERLNAWDLDRELAGGDPPLVVDVRAAAEATSDPVQGAVSIPLADMPERLAELPEGRRVVLACNTGYRSAVAAGVAESAGYKVSDLRGGLAAWRGTGAESCSMSS